MFQVVKMQNGARHCRGTWITTFAFSLVIFLWLARSGRNRQRNQINHKTETITLTHYLTLSVAEV